jgi:hypothetical protein
MTRYYFEDDYFGDEQEVAGMPATDVVVSKQLEEYDDDEYDAEMDDDSVIASMPVMGGTFYGIGNSDATYGNYATYGNFATHHGNHGNKSMGSIRWAKVELGLTTLFVCNTGGYVRRMGDPFWHVVKGAIMDNSPYSYIMVETEKNKTERFLIHELVWKAFQGDVLPDWELRHKPYIAREFPREYPNDLCHLELYPKVLLENYNYEEEPEDTEEDPFMSS